MSNTFSVTVQLVPGGSEVFNSDTPITVERAMGLAKVAKIANWTPKIGGETVKKSKTINSDTRITLIKKKIKGNR